MTKKARLTQTKQHIQATGTPFTLFLFPRFYFDSESLVHYGKPSFHPKQGTADYTLL